MTAIHETAIVHRSAEIDESVEVGPYTVIEPGVMIGPDCRIGPHCRIATGTRLGARNTLTGSVSIGTPPQDLKYGSVESRLDIGDDNLLREFVTINRGTPKEELLTRIGNRNLMMAGCHVGHDCVLGDNIVMTNCALLGGHVHLGDNAVLSGFVGVGQFTSIGRMAYVGAASRVMQDVPPFVKVAGDPAEVRMVNEVGMQRAGVSQADIDEIKHVYRSIFRLGRSVVEEAHNLINDDSPLVRELAEFLLRKEAGRYGRFRESLRGHE
ncbi:MAG: acyl-ACP--UDP-N-acetylglucosamine O-acyltransferase [Planctomycetota bacterium]|jgi:UDP-N-acetylglucosamine acyltransferase